VVYEVFEHFFGEYKNKIDLTQILKEMSGSILKKFQFVLTSVSGSFISVPKVYSYLVENSVLTSSLVGAGGLSVFYRYLFPFLTGLLSKIYAEFTHSLQNDLVDLTLKPLKIISNL
jgi:hypothetical protein